MTDIVQDENIAYGKPRINKTGIPVTIIVGRFIAGESITELADDYSLPRHKIESALRYYIKETGGMK